VASCARRPAIIRVDLAALQAGNVDESLLLRDGDTVVISRAPGIYVVWAVRTPGHLCRQQKTHCCKRSRLPEDLTERIGAPRAIIREVNGRKTRPKVKADDDVQPGDRGRR
jgi:hypothetical protein